MSTTQNVVVRSTPYDRLRRYVTLKELSEFVVAAYAAGAQPDDGFRLDGGLEIEIPTPEERADRAKWRQR